jgi:hypothetical protein
VLIETALRSARDAAEVRQWGFNRAVDWLERARCRSQHRLFFGGAPQPSPADQTYPSGVDRRRTVSASAVAGFACKPDKLDQVFETKIGEGLDAVFSDAVDPDDAILDLHFVGDIAQLQPRARAAE